ncbi:MAG TPA: 23S rRNA (guanosine(2251)-2'-O)-methyltransferase RlmB [Stellaceae bacterium]|nr:23S rRNA (guanosine(2251)-2'-O)-methyltransferase RlmB [Stellaceae bacterium]
MRPSRPHQKGFRPRRSKAAPDPSAAHPSVTVFEPRARLKPPAAGESERWLYGRHAVAAALANPARRWRRLVALAGHETEAAELAAAARAEKRGAGESVQALDRIALAALLPEGAVHQGLALEVEPLATPDIDDVLRAATLVARAVVVVLDQVTDPHNVGAVLRSAAAFGALAVVIADHNAPPASGALAKAASGALDLVPLVRVVNIARTLDQFKAAGFWCCGLDETAPEPLSGLDLGSKAVLVLGSEGGGLRRLVRERCDFLARLPTRPPLASLNVSNAAAVALYELARGK